MEDRDMEKKRFKLTIVENDRMIARPLHNIELHKENLVKGNGRKKLDENVHKTTSQLAKELNRQCDRLWKVETSGKSWVHLTLTTSSTSVSFDKLDKDFYSLMREIKRHFKQFAFYAKRIEINRRNYKHLHILVVFDCAKVPKGLTRKWVCAHWHVGKCCRCTRKGSFATYVGYLCKIKLGDKIKKYCNETKYPAGKDVLTIRGNISSGDMKELVVDQESLNQEIQKLSNIKASEGKELKAFCKHHKYVNDDGEIIECIDKEYYS